MLLLLILLSAFAESSERMFTLPPVETSWAPFITSTPVLYQAVVGRALSLMLPIMPTLIPFWILALALPVL